MWISDKGINGIKRFEGCRLQAYKCPANVWTIGYGHTKGVKAGAVISMAQAESLLRSDLLPIEKYLNDKNNIPVDLTQSQFDALCSFCFNLGVQAFHRSTLRKYIIAKKPSEAITGQILLWCHAGGKVLNGLVKRRQWEAELWEE